MHRLWRLSLVQLFLLVALFALVASVGVTLRQRLGVTFCDSSLAFSPDGHSVAIGIGRNPLFSRDHPVVIQSLNSTDSQTHFLKGHTWLVDGVAFSRDGSLLASCSGGDHTVRLWDVNARRELKSIATVGGDAHCLAFSPDGATLATGGNDGMLRLWDVQTGRERAALTGHTAWVKDVEFSPDGKWLVSGGQDDCAKVWEAETQQLVMTIKCASSVDDIAFLPDGRLAATGGPLRENGSRTVQLFQLPSATVSDQFTIDFAESVSGVAVSPDGQTIAAGHLGKITLWDVSIHRRLVTLTGHDQMWVEALAFSPDGTRLVTGSQNNIILLWDLSTDQPEKTTLLATNRQLPWLLVFGGGFFWATAWYFAPRPAKTAEVSARDSNSSVGV